PEMPVVTKKYKLCKNCVMTNYNINNKNQPETFASGDGVFLSTNNGTNWIAANTGLTTTSVLALAVSGTNLIAGTEGGGAFLSTNNGTSWTATGLTNLQVQAVAISGTNLFAGTEGGGVFLSTNNGTSWTTTGLTGPDVCALAISGTNLFAGTWSHGILRRPIVVRDDH
ncbi:MAG: hypothetical protein Q8O92_04820, partial [Candidatus Latescibacter sp.]|nr:hypothetical protein [Candidatus Latescibacter sp.]